MRLKIVTTLCVLFFLSGCATVKLNGAETQKSEVDEPPVGKVVTAYVGDRMLQKGEIVKENALRVSKTIDGVMYDIQQGVYKQIGYDDKANYYSANGVIKSALADRPKGLKLKKNPNSELCVVTVFNGKTCYAGDYERVQKISKRGASFQQTLLYSGKVGKKIRITYREFSNNMARPAYSNDAVYDLSSSKIIGYKGAKIKVINADNDSITYKVLSNFP